MSFRRKIRERLAVLKGNQSKVIAEREFALPERRE